MRAALEISKIIWILFCVLQTFVDITIDFLTLFLLASHRIGLSSHPVKFYFFLPQEPQLGLSGFVHSVDFQLSLGL
jgi:hypothetical protein